jgi:trans-L-3-hydroxyproline dehydratase
VSRTNISVVDMHTAGEPVRIVTGGYPELAGASLLEKRRDALARHDEIRRLVMLEPRGHGGMYGVIPLPPTRPEADLSVLFTHNEGYSTMCGHATIAIGRWAVETGRVAVDPATPAFTMEAPCGLVRVALERGNGADAPFVWFESVPAFASHLDRRIELAGFGPVRADIAFGGAYYAILPSSRLGLNLATTALGELIAAGVAVTEAARKAVPIEHPGEPDLGFLYGTILTDDAAPADGAPSYNLCVFADGQVDRSPTGSGATARMALDHARGLIEPGRRREFRGISGQGFLAEIAVVEGEGAASRVRARVGGRSYYTGEATFRREDADPIGAGFHLPPRFAEVMR